MFDGKAFGEITAGGFARAGTVMKINLSLLDLPHRLAFERHIGALVVERKVLLGNGELRLQKALIDRSELTYAQRTKIDRLETHKEKVSQRWLENLIRQFDLRQRRTGRRDHRIAREEAAVVG